MKKRSAVGFAFFLPSWLREPLLSIGVAKEVREIFPYWLVSAVTSLLSLVAGGFGEGDGVAFVSLIVGELATVAMGAMMFGHEFTHRTVSLMLAQPVSRRELWQRKMAVLAAALGVTLLFRLAGPILHGNGYTMFSFAGLMSVSGILYGLTVAPWLTLASRSALAGTVFTVCLPVVTWQVAGLAVALAQGSEVAYALNSPTTQSLFVLLAVLQWLAAPFLGYRALRRLEATDAGSRDVRLPQLLRRVPTQTRSTRSRGGAWARLLGKELRLLSPAYVVAGLYLVICGADIASRLLWPGVEPLKNASDLLALGTLIYGALISLLAGSLGCAEDRHGGTLLWHLVQPVAAWRQWLVKAGVAVGLALALAVALPLGVIQVETAVGLRSQLAGSSPAWLPGAALQVVALCLLGLYISSVARSTIQAMLWALPIAFVLETLGVGLFASPANHGLLLNWLLPFETEGRSFACPVGIAALALWSVLAAGFVITTLLCGYRNFRRLDQGTLRVLGQVAVMVGYCAVAGVASVEFALWCRADGATLPARPESLESREAPGQPR